MIYIDKNFRFYDDSKDLETFPELKPSPDAVALKDEEVEAITADITRWRWHPTDLKPYKIPGCETKYTKTVDGVIVEMSVEEKAAVDKAEADALVAKLAAEKAAADAAAQAQAELEAKIVARMADFEANLPTWAQVKTAVDNIRSLAEAKAFIKKLSRVVYWIAKDQAD